MTARRVRALVTVAVWLLFLAALYGYAFGILGGWL